MKWAVSQLVRGYLKMIEQCRNAIGVFEIFFDLVFEFTNLSKKLKKRGRKSESER